MNYLEHGTLITYTQVLKFLDVRTCLSPRLFIFCCQRCKDVTELTLFEFIAIRSLFHSVSKIIHSVYQILAESSSAASMVSGRTRKVADVRRFVRGCSASMFPLHHPLQ